MKKTLKIIALLFVVGMLVSCGNENGKGNENENIISMMPPPDNAIIGFYHFETYDDFADAVLYPSEMREEMLADAERLDYYSEWFDDALDMFLNGEMTLLIPKFEINGEEVPYQKDYERGDVFLHFYGDNLYSIPSVTNYYELDENNQETGFTARIFYPEVLKNEDIYEAESIYDILPIVKCDKTDLDNSEWVVHGNKGFNCYEKEFVIRNGTKTKAIVYESDPSGKHRIDNTPELFRPYNTTSVYMYIDNVIVVIRIRSEYFSDELMKGFYLEPYIKNDKTDMT